MIRAAVAAAPPIERDRLWTRADFIARISSSSLANPHVYIGRREASWLVTEARLPGAVADDEAGAIRFAPARTVDEAARQKAKANAATKRMPHPMITMGTGS